MLCARMAKSSLAPAFEILEASKFLPAFRTNRDARHFDSFVVGNPSALRAFTMFAHRSFTRRARARLFSFDSVNGLSVFITSSNQWALYRVQSGNRLLLTRTCIRRHRSLFGDGSLPSIWSSSFIRQPTTSCTRTTTITAPLRYPLCRLHLPMPS